MYVLPCELFVLWLRLFVYHLVSFCMFYPVNFYVPSCKLLYVLPYELYVLPYELLCSTL